MLATLPSVSHSFVKCEILVVDHVSLGFLADGHVYALDFDWITGNIYGSGFFGYIFVCKTTSSLENFVCATVLRGSSYQLSLRGIAVHPAEGYAFLKPLHLAKL